ncbi:hypothetical protein ERO13_A08G085862v2 [Gossypium hirsutum]|uniref:Uncharacterized protein n=2 Tax=Gossypium TaxID=3633 RepID=A0A5D2Y6J2_GOSMU|nr:hypothetical protein ERO13_A08G085862v2 [Gossypium hirsutum]KAG4187123.1 hypothetical protein ERO13_A08G085862v2 [Gossypium hirsutum]TYI14085.1 hypothetical protein ES332_A08G101200v1 [Gossypium tomentosum]TYI14086.1 hypothetical protein ES332_A08G101200v1 [Gossypium tomentosum]TYJ21975.1 hypothetical protein E1A91_A08G098100v1 [Gossypium mustelinum]
MQRNQNAIKKLKTSFFFSRTSNFSLIFSVRLSRPFVFHRLSCVARNIVFQCFCCKRGTHLRMLDRP